MPIRTFIGNGRSFNPETIEIMNAAFLVVCEDLRLDHRTDRAAQTVATRVIEMSDGQRDPQAIRAAVLAILRESAAGATSASSSTAELR